MDEARQSYIQSNQEFLKKRDSKKYNQSLLSEYGRDCTSILKKYPDFELQNSWNTMEKETLKKHLL